MDPLELLPVKFFLGDEFVHYGDSVSYVGGDEAMSHIERDKLSLPELVGHLKDHMNITDKDNVSLHWLFPGKELNNGLRPLSDDKVCAYMSECITDGGVATVYAMVIHESSEEDEESDYEYELEETDSEGDEELIPVTVGQFSPSKQCNLKDTQSFRAFYKSPMKPTGKHQSPSKQNSDGTEQQKEKRKVMTTTVLLEMHSSEDDEEAKENRKNAFQDARAPLLFTSDCCADGLHADLIKSAVHVGKSAY